MCQTKCCRNPKSLLAMGIVFVVLAGIFLIGAIIIKPIIQNEVEDTAKFATALKQSNFDSWSKVPGKLDIMVYRNYFLYNCNNTEQIYFGQQVPHCHELSPVEFYESSVYSNPEFKKMPLPSDASKEYKAVKLAYDVDMVPSSDYPHINDTITFANAALFGAWQGNAAPERYSMGMTSLYNIISGMSGALVDTATNTVLLQDLLFSSESLFAANLAVNTSLSSSQIQQLYYDQYYGFSPNSPDTGIAQTSRVARWTAMCPNASSANTPNATTRNEIMSYFGIEFEDMEDLLGKFLCPMFSDSRQALLDLVCSQVIEYQDGHCSPLNIAYYQWSAGQVTQVNNQQSITQADPTVIGYPEISFFLQEFFRKSPNRYNPSGAEDQFTAVDFSKQGDVNFYRLLNYNNLTESCLLYLDTMRSLLGVGDAFNITASSKKDGDKLITNFTAFNAIAARLQVTPVEAYVIYCYIDAIITKSVYRQDDGSTPSILVLAEIATNGVKTQVNDILSHNLPRALYAEMILSSFPENGVNCSALSKLYFPSAENKTLTAICGSNASNFNTSTSFYNWITLFTDRNANAMQVFNITNLTLPLTDLYNKAGKFALNLTAVRRDLKTSLASAGVPCTSLNSTADYCSDFELGIQQWAFGDLSLHPPASIAHTYNSSDSASAFLTRVTGKESKVAEYYAFLNRSNNQALAAQLSTKQLFTRLSSGGDLVNLKITQDMFITQTFEEGVVNSTVWRDFLRYSGIEFTFEGMFRTVTVYQALHGYEDALLNTVKNQPLYAGGAPYTNNKLAIIGGDTSYMAFFTGEDDYRLGKVYAEYNNSTIVNKPKTRPVGNGSSFEYVDHNPWKANITLKGTDASKFPAQLSKSDTIWSFVSDIMIPLQFYYVDQKEKSGLTTHEYKLEPSMLAKSDENPLNKNYYMDKFSGLANLTSLESAPVFASQCRYLGVPPNQEGLNLPVLYDPEGNVYSPDEERDGNRFFLEYYTGAQVEGYQRLQSNFFAQNDILFNMTTTKQNFNFLVPYAYIQRSTDLSDHQINKLFGELKTALGMIVPLIIIFTILCALFLGLSIWMFVRRRKQVRRESYLLLDDKTSVVSGGVKSNRTNPAVEVL